MSQIKIYTHFTFRKDRLQKPSVILISNSNRAIQVDCLRDARIGLVLTLCVWESP